MMAVESVGGAQQAGGTKDYLRACNELLASMSAGERLKNSVLSLDLEKIKAAVVDHKYQHERAIKAVHAFAAELSFNPVGQGDAESRTEVDSYQHAAAQADAAASAAPASLTLDQLADDTLIRVAAFIGECVGGDTFAGFSVDEVRDEHGLLLSLALVPCDIVDGEPVRRVGR